MALVSSLSTNKALAKLTIIPFAADKNGNIKPAGVPFIAMYNPSSLSRQNSISLVEKNTSDGVKSPLEFKSEGNEVLDINLFLDATGASPAGGLVGATLSKTAKALHGVDLLVANFFATTKLPNPKTHEPNVLRLIWGAGLFFECQLESATVAYNLFDRTGRPLRATISAKFKEYATQSAISKIKNFFSSPDVTKTYIVKAGDTIYNLAETFYEDESFYLRIAEANNLKNYRRLTPGMTLILPPVQKVEA
jgi:nucleoid-associated protein YgaU